MNLWLSNLDNLNIDPTEMMFVYKGQRHDNMLNFSRIAKDCKINRGFKPIGDYVETNMYIMKEFYKI